MHKNAFCAANKILKAFKNCANNLGKNLPIPFVGP